MGRRGRKRKIRLNVDRDTLKSAVAIISILFAGIILISFIFPSYDLNSKVQAFTSGLFGKVPALLLPGVLLIGGLLYTQALKWKFVELRVFLGLILLLFSLSSLFSVAGFGGGKIGDSIASFIIDAISKVGAGFVFLALILLSVFVVLNKSFVDLVEFIEAVSEKTEGLNLAFWKKKGEGEEDEEIEEDQEKDDIKITSGGSLLGNVDEEEEDKEEEIKEPSFEVIPSVSEPKSDGDEIKGLAKNQGKTSPNLPYPDKIWEPPPRDLLSDPPASPVTQDDVRKKGKVIVQTLKSFGIKAEIKEINKGPSVTQYALDAESGVRISKVANLHHDLALALASPNGTVRIEAPIPGRSLIGIEVPNDTRTNVYFKEILTSDAMKSMKSKRGIVLGKDVSGTPHAYDIAKMPHILVAGATGSGKSVFLHSLIFSLIYRCSPQECKFIFMDPKRVELVHYREIPHLLTPVVTDTDKAALAFRWAVKEMERRYNLLEQAKVRNIDAYNKKSGFQALPYVIIAVDELAEIMVSDPAAVEKDIIRLAQLARATGIHLVLAVQRPDTTVITGLIKANIPCRVAFNVTSQVDSRVIIDQPGAEKLLGEGDMLFRPPDAQKPTRLQGAFVQSKEIDRVVNYLKNTGIDPDYKEEVFEVKSDQLSISAGGEQKDELFDEAVRICVNAGKGSASLLQRRLSVGYARAARILDELAAEGYVGPARGNKARKLRTDNIPLEEYDIPEETASDLI